jgi:SAM-dependent methyltransferase
MSGLQCRQPALLDALFGAAFQRRLSVLAALNAALIAWGIATPWAAWAEEHGGDHDATVRHSFEDVEKWVAVFDDSARVSWQKPDSIAAALPLTAGKVILDIGAGTGYFNRAFAERVRPGGRVFAADIEPGFIAHMLERARREQTPEVFPLLIPADEPRVPMAVDVVFICDTYHHIDDRLTYIAKLANVLRDRGVIAIVDFTMGEIPVGPPPEHRIPRDHVIAEMDSAGFRLAREEAFLPYQYFLVFEREP